MFHRYSGGKWPLLECIETSHRDDGGVVWCGVEWKVRMLSRGIKGDVVTWHLYCVDISASAWVERVKYLINIHGDRERY